MYLPGKGGFITLRQNEVTNFAVQKLTKVCDDVRIEPELKPLSEDVIYYESTTDDARVDALARSVWIWAQLAFSNIRSFNILANCYNLQNLKSIYVRHEKEKKRFYNQRILQFEKGSFIGNLVYCYIKIHF